MGSLVTLALLAVPGSRSWASLLRVGSANPLLGRIQSDLGPVPSPDPVGHDGQLYYVVARDPLNAGGTAEALARFDNNNPRYRYRRILYPALAGGFGRFSGPVTLFGMIALTTLGMGLMAVAAADLSYGLRLSAGTALLATLNAGAFISAMLLTADALGLGLALAGLALARRNYFHASTIVLAMATLTKEVYLLVPLAVGALLWRKGDRREAAWLALVPVAALSAWSVCVSSVIPEFPNSVQHVGLPALGLVETLPKWLLLRARNPVQFSIAVYLMVTLGAAAVMLIAGRNAQLRWILAPWILLAGCSTVAVWTVPTNAARGLAIIWPLTVFAIADLLRVRRRDADVTAADERPLASGRR